mmetsp:Transcript_3592/g.5998  ORF Transcript_3592/g.5998 Transcript_3592/m.5998 type:complete len:111 (+) Transcript_3592:2492-2824(+)
MGIGIVSICWWSCSPRLLLDPVLGVVVLGAQVPAPASKTFASFNLCPGVKPLVPYPKVLARVPRSFTFTCRALSTNGVCWPALSSKRFISSTLRSSLFILWADDSSQRAS